jgi:hypothetical protein
MEALMELVAARFARHGIECPGDDRHPASPDSAQASRPAEPIPATASPELHYSEGLQGDPAP